MDSSKSRFTQVSLTLIASATMLSSGMNVAFPAVALPALQGNFSQYEDKDLGTAELRINRSQASWVASLPQLSMIVGCLAVGPILDTYGRRIGLILSTLPAAVGWLVMGLVPAVWSLYAGRLLTGLSMGITGPACSVYVAEIASPATRSALTLVKTVAFSLGLTFTYFCGYLYKTEWRVVAVVSGMFPLGCLLLVAFYIPESHVWLAMGPRPKPPQSQRFFHKPFHFFLNARPQVLKPMLIMNILLFLRQMAGTSAILSYAVEIVGAAGVRQDAYLVATLLGATRLLAGLLASWLSSRLGRRLPVTYSGVAMSAAMLTIASSINKPMDTCTYMPAFFLFSFVLCSTIYGAIPQSMIAEVFPTDVRGMSASATSLTIYSTSFLALKAYHLLVDHYGRGGLFTFYGCLSVLSTLFSILFLPETHGKSLQDIEKMFNKKLGSREDASLPLNPP